MDLKNVETMCNSFSEKRREFIGPCGRVVEVYLCGTGCRDGVASMCVVVYKCLLGVYYIRVDEVDMKSLANVDHVFFTRCLSCKVKDR